MLREIWFFVSESLSVPFPTWSNVPSALQIPLPPPVPTGPSLFSKSPVHLLGDVTGKAVGRGSVGSFPLPGLSSARRESKSVLCSGGDAVLGNWSWGHLPQTCHQQVKRPCPVLSLITPLAKGRSFLVQSLPSWLPESLFPFLDPQKTSLP